MGFSRLCIWGVILTSSSLQAIYGAEFFRKQTGSVTISAAQTSASAAIVSVDLSRSFLVFSSTVNSNQPQHFQVGGEITNATTLNFYRTGNAGNVTIRWQVFEFESGVYVQHGSTTNVARGAPVNVAINCVDLTKSFVLISARKSGSQLGADDGITANLTTSTNMELMISNAGPGGANMEEAYWQVIEYQAATVKKLTTTLSAGSTSTTSTISPAITTLSKAFVVSNHWFNGDVNSNDLPRTELTNVNTVTYTRVGTATDMNFVTYVIEFTDGSTVTRGTQNFASGVTTQPVSITATASSGVIAPGNFGRQGSTSFATDDNPGHNWFVYDITSSSNLQITRAIGTGSTADAPWQIITFEDTGLQQNTFYSRASGSWESNTSWSFTSNGSSGAVPTGVYPRRTNNVVVQSGHIITIDNVNDNGPCSQSPNNLGRSNVGTFTGSADQMFYHTGDIIISTGGRLNCSEEIMIEGYTLVESGGILAITEDIVNLGYFEVASGATFTNTDDLILSGNSITIINNTSFGADDIYIDWTNATLCGDGIMNLGNGGADPTIQFFNGGSLSQVCSTFTVTCTSNCGAFPITPTGSFISGIAGPGGVGNSNNNKLWLMADRGVFSDAGTTPAVDLATVQQWNDQSGNGNNASQGVVSNRPIFRTGQDNNLPALEFTGNLFIDGPNLGISAGSSLDYFMVFRDTQTGLGGLNDGNGHYILDRTPATSALMSLKPVTGSFYGFQKRSDSGGGLGGPVTTTSINTQSKWIELVRNLGVNYRIYYRGQQEGSIADGDGNLTPPRPRIGRHATTANNGLRGFVNEFIIYRTAINEAQRVIINNYISAKYNITLPVNDVYTMDNPGNGNFDFEVAGIGQATNGSNHRDARGTGVVRMWNPNGLNNGEFLIWGHDNAAITSTTTAVGTAVDGTVIQERLTRIWRASESGGDVGNVSISFDFSGVGGSPLGSNLRLLIDRDGDGFADNDVTPIVGSVSNGIAVFSNVNFQNGDRFTLGNTDASVPLPVELVEFIAKPINHSVLLKWVTSSELNNDHFIVERSHSAEEWEAIEQIKGAGTTDQSQRYQIIDKYPLAGVSYYRLKQTDFDGTVAYSHIVSVVSDGLIQVSVSPNPSNGIFTVKGANLAGSELRVLTGIGQYIQVPINIVDGQAVLDLTTFPQGVYIVQVFDGLSIQSLRLVRR